MKEAGVRFVGESAVIGAMTHVELPEKILVASGKIGALAVIFEVLNVSFDDRMQAPKLSHSEMFAIDDFGDELVTCDRSAGLRRVYGWIFVGILWLLAYRECA